MPRNLLLLRGSRLNRLMTDVSPISVKKIVEAWTPMGWYNYHLTGPSNRSLSTRLRTAGLGFKASSRPMHSSNHGRKARRLIVILAYASCRHVVLSFSIALGTIIPPCGCIEGQTY